MNLCVCFRVWYMQMHEQKSECAFLRMNIYCIYSCVCVCVCVCVCECVCFPYLSMDSWAESVCVFPCVCVVECVSIRVGLSVWSDLIGAH